MEIGEGAVEGDDVSVSNPDGNFFDREIGLTQQAGGFAQPQHPGMVSKAESVAATELRPQMTRRPSGPRGHHVQAWQWMGLLPEPIGDGANIGQCEVRGRLDQCGIFLKSHQQKNQEMGEAGRLTLRPTFTAMNFSHKGAGPIRGGGPMPDLGKDRQGGPALAADKVLHPNDTAGFACGSFKGKSRWHQQHVSSFAWELTVVGLKSCAPTGDNDQIVVWPLSRADASVMRVGTNPVLK